jgi:hypothetical protein
MKKKVLKVVIKGKNMPKEKGKKALLHKIDKKKKGKC